LAWPTDFFAAYNDGSGKPHRVFIYIEGNVVL
jgi:ribosomal protein L27